MDYNNYGLVLSDQLIQTEPPFRDFLNEMKQCDNDGMPVFLRPYISKRLRSIKQNDKTLFHKLFAVERLRFEQRKAAMTQGGEMKDHGTDVIVFACQIHDSETLQSTLLPYVLCATALNYIPNTRMIICNGKANHHALTQLAESRGVKQLPLERITCLPYIDSFKNLMQVLNTVSENERISLLYLSSHGVAEGLFGRWGPSITPRVIKDEEMSILADFLNKKRAPDTQVFLNSCYSAIRAAPMLSFMVPCMIIMGSDKTIPTKSIHHHFAVDMYCNRLYATFNSVELRLCEIKAFYYDPDAISDSDYDPTDAISDSDYDPNAISDSDYDPNAISDSHVASNSENSREIIDLTF